MRYDEKVVFTPLNKLTTNSSQLADPAAELSVRSEPPTPSGDCDAILAQERHRVVKNEHR